jgi:hypothetical protein
MRRLITSPAVVACALGVFALVEAEGRHASEARRAAIAHAQVWSATNVPAIDLRLGPSEPNGFEQGETVNCDYVNKKLAGNSPKFACRIGEDDEVKVKFGGKNGEVYAEVAATRLLWALGFGADRMYPVRVVCRGCPDSFLGTVRGKGESVFDPAVIERKMPGRSLEGDDGWAWNELELIEEQAGGAPMAHRDALKLLAVFLQHTDNKPQQQRILCLDEPAPSSECARPFMMINDLGLTFGRANRANTNLTGSANLAEWSRTPVWKRADSCVGNLPKSFSGTLNDPVISEEGRRFLAGLLVQLSDAQLNDLFEVARFRLRPRSPEDGRSGFPSTQEWVDAFKQKRTEILDHRCP